MRTGSLRVTGTDYPRAMPDPSDVAPSVRVPAAAITIKAVRSSGPGGQNVNKVASKIELSVEVAAIEGLDETARRRLQSLAGKRLSSDGWLRITSGENRDQFRNLETAREKVRSLVARALVVPQSRRATQPTLAAIHRRILADTS